MPDSNVFNKNLTMSVLGANRGLRYQYSANFHRFIVNSARLWHYDIKKSYSWGF